MKTKHAIWAKDSTPEPTLGMVVDMFDGGSSYLIGYPDDNNKSWCCIASMGASGAGSRYYASVNGNITAIYPDINAWRDKKPCWTRKSQPESAPDPNVQNVVLYENVPYLKIQYALSNSVYYLNLLTGLFALEPPHKDKAKIQAIWRDLNAYYVDLMS